MPVEIGWGQEDQEDDEVSGPSEETRTPVKMNDPHAPSQKEREQHEMTHLPFRSWCWKCVFGRGKEMPHRRNKDEKVMPEVHLDFMFLGPKDSPGDTVPCLVMREVVSNMVMAAVVPRKTTGLFAAKRALAFLSEVGCLHGDLIVRSDQEPAITSLVNEVGRLRGAAGGGRFIVEASPVGSSGSNGRVERAIQSVQDQVRVMRVALQDRWKVDVSHRHAVFPGCSSTRRTC